MARLLSKFKRAFIDLSGCQKCQVYAKVSEKSESTAQFYQDQRAHMLNEHGIVMA